MYPRKMVILKKKATMIIKSPVNAYGTHSPYKELDSHVETVKASWGRKGM